MVAKKRIGFVCGEDNEAEAIYEESENAVASLEMNREIVRAMNILVDILRHYGNIKKIDVSVDINGGYSSKIKF